MSQRKKPSAISRKLRVRAGLHADTCRGRLNRIPNCYLRRALLALEGSLSFNALHPVADVLDRAVLHGQLNASRAVKALLHNFRQKLSQSVLRLLALLIVGIARLASHQPCLSSNHRYVPLTSAWLLEHIASYGLKMKSQDEVLATCKSVCETICESICDWRCAAKYSCSRV